MYVCMYVAISLCIYTYMVMCVYVYNPLSPRGSGDLLVEEISPKAHDGCGL